MSTSAIPSNAVLSLIVPWVHIKCTKEYITDVMENANWGTIESVQLVSKKASKRSPEHYKVFIHFSELNDQGTLVKDHLSQDSKKEIKLQHRFGFWLIRKSEWKFDENFKAKKMEVKVEFL